MTGEKRILMEIVEMMLMAKNNRNSKTQGEVAKIKVKNRKTEIRISLRMKPTNKKIKKIIKKVNLAGQSRKRILT